MPGLGRQEAGEGADLGEVDAQPPVRDGECGQHHAVACSICHDEAPPGMSDAAREALAAARAELGPTVPSPDVPPSEARQAWLAERAGVSVDVLMGRAVTGGAAAPGDNGSAAGEPAGAA